MRPGLFYLKSLFFLSGGACLIYEVVWTRVYADIVGSTALAMTAVFAGFLLFLALGAQLFGRLAVYGRKALTLYGAIELAIALSALPASALLLRGGAWIASHRPAAIPIGLAYDFATVGLLVGVPVLLMGATLPVILNASKALALPRNVVAQLYGWNTLGAACGTIAAGFVLIWKLGLWGTLLTAMGINAAIGCAALALGRRAMGETPPPETETQEVGRPSPLFPLWLLLAWLSGFSVLGYEVLWGRMAKFLLGDRTLAISALLAIFIACLGVGSLLADPLRRRFGATAEEAVRLIAWIVVLGAFLHLALIPLACSTVAGGGLTGLLGFLTSEFARRVLCIWLLVFPPIVVMGVVFPLIACSARDLDATPGRVVGNLYLVNSVGAALGASCAAFALNRSCGTLGGFLALSLLLVGAGAALLWLRPAPIAQRAAGLAALCVALLVAAVFPRSLVELREDETLVAACEDEYGVQVLAATKRDTLRVRNNRLHLVYDLGHPQTSHAQQMAAHLTVLLADRCGEVINIGTGYGITAGTFTLYPDVRSIRTIEILPFLVEQQPRFADYNFRYLSDPRVTLVQGDGRHALTASPRRYDIISVNVLDPYLPGSSSLYTVDFWELARERLNDGGAYTQLFWGRDVPLLVKGLRKVFPTVLFFPAYGGTSYNIVAFKKALAPGQVRLHDERIGPRAAAAIREITGEGPRACLPQLLSQAWRIQHEMMRRADATPGRCHTDNFPILEYRWAHGGSDVSILDSPLVVE